MDTKKIYELGYYSGKSLSDIEECDKQISSVVLNEDVYPKIQEINRKIANNESQLEKYIEKLEFISSKSVTIKAELDKLMELREKEYLFSLFKGGLFLFVSILFIYADIALLGGVIGALFNMDVTNENGVLFSNLFFSSPFQTLVEFPEIIAMSLTVLLLGFYLKIIEDTLSESFEKKTNASIKSRTFYLIEIIAGIISLIILIVVAWARYITPISEEVENSTSVQLFSALLGFTLPYISAIFFMRGYTKVKNELKLFKFKLKSLIVDKLIDRYTNKITKIKGKITYLIEQKNYFSNQYFSKIIDSYRMIFKNGYNNAIDELIESKHGGLYEKFRMIAIKKAINPN